MRLSGSRRLCLLTAALCVLCCAADLRGGGEPAGQVEGLAQHPGQPWEHGAQGNGPDRPAHHHGIHPAAALAGQPRTRSRKLDRGANLAKCEAVFGSSDNGVQITASQIPGLLRSSPSLRHSSHSREGVLSAHREAPGRVTAAATTAPPIHFRSHGAKLWLWSLIWPSSKQLLLSCESDQLIVTSLPQSTD